MLLVVTIDNVFGERGDPASARRIRSEKEHPGRTSVHVKSYLGSAWICESATIHEHVRLNSSAQR
jgi:hypothetical protein